MLKCLAEWISHWFNIILLSVIVIGTGSIIYGVCVGSWLCIILGGVVDVALIGFIIGALHDACIG